MFKFTNKSLIVKFQRVKEPKMEAETKNNVRKIIIDTDPGIDDAMAIMIALKEHKKGNISILAITLVNGNSSTDNAQVNILRVLEVFNLQNEVLNIN